MNLSKPCRVALITPRIPLPCLVTMSISHPETYDRFNIINGPFRTRFMSVSMGYSVAAVWTSRMYSAVLLITNCRFASSCRFCSSVFSYIEISLSI